MQALESLNDSQVTISSSLFSFAFFLFCQLCVVLACFLTVSELG